MRRRHAFLFACAVASAGCLDRDGLEPGVGIDGGSDAPGGGSGGKGGGGSGGQMGGKGGGGAGGSGGQMGGTGGQIGGSGGQMGGSGGQIGGTGGGGSGGQMGGTGGKADAGTDVPPMCGPVCAIFCPNGNVLDDRGCPTCRCNPPPMCTPVTCKLFCQFGFKKDAQGCEICACNDAPDICAPAECGSRRRVAQPHCADGTVAGPVCERTSTGRCAWIFRPCPDGCGDARNPTACLALPACRWLEPGCTEPKLAVAGCYPRSLIGCDQRACPDGRQCVKRVINPCGSPDRAAGRPRHFRQA